MKKAGPTIVNRLNDIQTVHINSLADLKKIKSRSKKQQKVRLIINPDECLDPYFEILLKAIEFMGNPRRMTTRKLKPELRS